jgi:type IV fimbrial biogenesis protein FimT
MRKNDLNSGFTVVELLVTITMVAILMALAVPSLQQFLVRSEMQSLSNDFANALQKARLEAVSRNMCVTVCPGQNLATNPQCRATLPSDNWNASGWLVYINPTCDTTITSADPATPANIFIVREPSNARFSLSGHNSIENFTFSSRGVLANAAATRVTLMDTENSANSLNRDICIDRMGRTRIEAEGAC